MDKYCIINKSNTNPDIKYLLSTSFFYLEKSYKSSQRYIDGILKIIQFINSNKYYGLRIYYDKSIFQNPQYKELYQTIKSNNKVELYQYTCSQFMVSETFHIGTFGTLLRFLPLFEQSEYKIIYILDIDDANYGYIDLYMDSLLKSEKKFYFYNLEDYGKKYGGKFYVRIEDTNPESIDKKAYESIKKDCDWIFGNVSDYIIEHYPVGFNVIYGCLAKDGKTIIDRATLQVLRAELNFLT
jgi:hypothetical protein